jgi:hypothetical protein
MNFMYSDTAENAVPLHADVAWAHSSVVIEVLCYKSVVRSRPDEVTTFYQFMAALGPGVY